MAGTAALMIALSAKTGRLFGASRAGLCAACFLWIERRGPEPLFDARLIRSRQILTATAGETIYYYYLCLYAIGFLVPFYLARGRGFTQAQIGVACQSAARAVAAPDGFSARLLTWLGTVLTAAGDALASGILACVGFVLGGFLARRFQGTIE